MPNTFLPPARSSNPVGITAHRPGHRLGRWLKNAATAAALGLAAATAAAAPSTVPGLSAGQSLSMTGSTLTGQPFSLAALKGKVVLVYYWDTGCAVCLDKMHELRANVNGWKGKPFVLVTVQLDRQAEDALHYWGAVGQSGVSGAMGPVLWRSARDFRDNLSQVPSTLPLSVLIDTQGKIVAAYEGRIPPQAWDQIADLLP